MVQAGALAAAWTLTPDSPRSCRAVVVPLSAPVSSIEDRITGMFRRFGDYRRPGAYGSNPTVSWSPSTVPESPSGSAHSAPTAPQLSRCSLHSPWPPSFFMDFNNEQRRGDGAPCVQTGVSHLCSPLQLIYYFFSD